MINTTNMREALQAFTEFAERVEQQSHGANEPQLLLYGDGSGCIVERVAWEIRTVYVDNFEDFTDLLHKLRSV